MSKMTRVSRGILAVLVVLVLAGLATQDFSLGKNGERMNEMIEEISVADASSGTKESATFALG